MTTGVRQSRPSSSPYLVLSTLAVEDVLLLLFLFGTIHIDFNSRYINIVQQKSVTVTLAGTAKKCHCVTELEIGKLEKFHCNQMALYYVTVTSVTVSNFSCNLNICRNDGDRVSATSISLRKTDHTISGPRPPRPVRPRLGRRDGGLQAHRHLRPAGQAEEERAAAAAGRQAEAQEQQHRAAEEAARAGRGGLG